MFTRIDLCALAALDTDHFKSLWHRNQLPLRRSGNSRARRAEFYSPLDVLTVAAGEALMCQVGGEKGLPTSVAMAIAERAREAVQIAYSDPSGIDIWAGCVASRFGRPRKDGKVQTAWCVCGPLSDVAEEIARDSSRSDGAAVRAFLVNVSEVVREVRTRARQAHIYFPENAATAAA